MPYYLWARLLIWFKSYQGLEESLSKPCLYQLPIKLVPQSCFLKTKQIVCFPKELSKCIFVKDTGGAEALKAHMCFSVGAVLEVSGEDVA